MAFLLFLCGLWLFLSGHASWNLLLLGAISVALVFGLSVRMGLIDSEGFPVHLLPRAPGFVIWLAVKVIESNLVVARLILQPRMRVDPSHIRFTASARTDIGRTCLANAITLTPGTVTLGVEGDDLVVHALTREAADDLEAGEMDRRATRLESAS